MYCRYCGKEIEEGAVYCRYCGKNQQFVVDKITIINVLFEWFSKRKWYLIGYAIYFFFFLLISMLGMRERERLPFLIIFEILVPLISSVLVAVARYYQGKNNNFDLRKPFLDKKKRQKELDKFAEKVGLNQDLTCLRFSQMNGAGVIKCLDCGYEEEIISNKRGDMSFERGWQCPKCLSFVVEHNVSQEKYALGKSEDDFICPKCGTVIREKRYFPDIWRYNPLVCPNCISTHLVYKENNPT
jgi:hypothetical protein